MRFNIGLLFTLPLILFLIIFLVIPISTIFIYSFWSTHQYHFTEFWHLKNYQKIFLQPAYRRAFIKALRNAVITTVIALLMGYPIAYFMERKVPQYSLIILLTLATPYFIGQLLRIIALQTVLGPLGFVNITLEKLFGVSLGFMYSNLATIVGLVSLWTPFMILAIDISLSQMDMKLIDVAKVEGANMLKAFWNVTFPLSYPGVVLGCALVFIPSLADSVMALFLGGPYGIVYGNLLFHRFSKSLTWGMGSALGVVLILFDVLVILGLLFSMKKFRKVGRG